MRTRRISAVALAIAASLVVAACGSSSSSSSSSSSGGSAARRPARAPARAAVAVRRRSTAPGSTFAAPIYQQWGSNLKSQGLTVNYNPVGSGTGIADLQTATVDFAGSDPALKPTDTSAMKGPVLQFPVAFGAITVSYNLSGVKSGLKLDGATIADIFLGKIKTWNDPAIKALNPGISLPSTAITVVHRSDSSGTTKGFTTFLEDYSPDVEVAGRRRQGREVADRHRRGEELRRRRRDQADDRRGRLRRAGVRARERVHVRRGQELERQLRAADDREHRRLRPSGIKSRRTSGSRRSTRRTPRRTRSSRRRSSIAYTDPCKAGGASQASASGAEEVPDLRVRRRAEDAGRRLEPAAVRAAAGDAGREGHRPSWRS